MKLINKPIIFSTPKIQHAFAIEELAITGREINRGKHFDNALQKEYITAVNNLDQGEWDLFRIVRQSMMTEIIDFN